MTKTRWRGALTVLSLVTLGGLAVTSIPSTPSTLLTGSGSNSANPNCNGAGNASCSPSTSGPVKDFGVRVGSITGIFPTGSKPIPLFYSNPHNFDIVVKTVSVTAADASPSCSASHLARPAGTVTLQSPVIVPANATNVPAPSTGPDATTLRVSLLNSAPNACQRVNFPITVTATAVKR